MRGTGGKLDVRSHHSRGTMRTFFFPLLLFIVGCCQPTMILYAQEDQEPALIISNGPMTKLGVAISPDGRTLIATGSGTPVLFDAVTGDSLRTFDGFTTLVYAAAWSPDGRRLLISSIRRAIIVGTDDWEVELDLGADSVRHQYNAMWSSDGSMVAFGDFEGVARIWDASTGALLHSHTFGGAIRDVQFIDNDTRLFISLSDGIPSLGSTTPTLAQQIERATFFLRMSPFLRSVRIGTVMPSTHGRC